MFEKEFATKIRNITAKLRDAVAGATKLLEEKKNINKTDRAYILDALQALIRELGANVPFVASQFSEQMDQTVKEAKAEIEAFVNKMTQLGLEATQEMKNMLEEGKDKE